MENNKPSEADPNLELQDNAEFERVLRNLMNKPHKPHGK
jgi:hypothetical protein